MPQVVVSEWTKEKLGDIKDKEHHQTFDSTIRSMILRLENDG